MEAKGLITKPSGQADTATLRSRPDRPMETGVQAEAEAELATPARLQQVLPCGRVGSEIQMFLISKLKK